MDIIVLESLCLIRDLDRVQFQKEVLLRNGISNLAHVNESVRAPLTQTDLLRFLRA